MLVLKIQKSTVRKKFLRGFERITLEPGQSKSVTITCPKDELMWYDANHLTWRLDNMDYQVYIGSSSADEDLNKGIIAYGE